MIRITGIQYNDLREEYLKRLSSIGAVEFDSRDILNDDKIPSEGRTQKTYDELSGTEYLINIRDKLYYNRERIKRNYLREILAGPEEMPRSLGGDGVENLLSLFNRIKEDLGECKNRDDRSKLKRIFKYKEFLKKGNREQLPYWLIQTLNLKTCPYCNVGYTMAYVGENQSFRTPLDHFFSKSRYPYLSVSLFNLVPACNTCNSIKHDSNKSIVYPFEESFDEGDNHCSFRVIPNYGHPEIWFGNSDEFRIEFHPRNDKTRKKENLFQLSLNQRFEEFIEEEYWKRIKNSVQLLCLEGIYSDCYRDEIQKLIRNYYEYNKHGIEMIMHDKKEAADNWLLRDMLYFASLKESEWGNSSFNKMKKDILEQLDQIAVETFKE